MVVKPAHLGQPSFLLVSKDLREVDEGGGAHAFAGAGMAVCPSPLLGPGAFSLPTPSRAPFLLRGHVPMPAPRWRSFVVWLYVSPGNRPRTYGSLLGHSVPQPPSPHGPPGRLEVNRHENEAPLVVTSAASFSLLPHPVVLPVRGRGSLLTCGDVEPNPGPPRPCRSAPPQASIALHAFLDRWHITDYLEVSSGYEVAIPLPGPCGSARPGPAVAWIAVDCVCGETIPLREQELRPLMRHIRTCGRLHARTGRGDALRTCGDVEENPGAPSKRLRIHVRPRTNPPGG